MRFERKDIPVIADEYVLGLMGTVDAETIEAEMERDAELRAAIAASRDRFLPLDTTAQPAPVSDALWTKIDAALPAQQSLSTADSEKPANDNWHNRWRVTAISAIAASLLLAVGLGVSLLRTVEPVVIAVLVNEVGEIQAVVEDFGNKNASIRLLADFDVPSDKTMQVWTLPNREMGPISLGLIEGTQSATLAAPSLPAPQSDQLYEITLEQAGGSPTGRPTGPILAKGFARFPR